MLSRGASGAPMRDEKRAKEELVEENYRKRH